MIAALSVPNSNFLCCVISQYGESSRDLLLSVTNRKALAPVQAPPPPWVLVGEKGLYFDGLPFNRWLKLFNSNI